MELKAIDQNLLVALDQYLTVAAWLLLIANLASKRVVNSVLLVCMMLVCYQTLSVIVRPLIIDFVSVYDKDIGRILYYFGFAFISLASVAALARLHFINAVPASFFSNFYAWALQAIAVIQVLRYIDRRAGTEYLEYVYSHGIPAINLAAVVLVAYGTGLSFYHRMKQKEPVGC